MSESLSEGRFQTHELFKPSDFTHQEYARGNKLAVAVIDGGLATCKRCGRSESELFDNYCNQKRKGKENE